MATEQEILRMLEKRLYNEYRDTEKAVKEKIAVLTASFEETNKLYLKQLKSGQIDEKAYKKWYKKQVTTEKWCNKMLNELSKDVTKTNVKASEIMNGSTPDMFIQGCIDGSVEIKRTAKQYPNFDLIDRKQAEILLKENKDLLPKAKVNIPKDQQWNKRRMRSAVLQSAIKGESIPKLSKRLQNVVGMNRTSAIRNARTMMTGTHNLGRMETGYEAIEMGINVKKEWIATEDGRTRKSHRLIDGEVVDMDKEFSNGLMYPADPDGEPAEVYNCRCSMGYVVGEPDENYRLDFLANRVLEYAERAEEYVTDDLSGAVHSGFGELAGLDFRFKGKGSLERKISDKSEKKNLDKAVYSKQITDALRYTNVSDPSTFTNDFFLIKRQLEDKGYKMIEVCNSIADKNAEYRGINTLVKSPEGYVFELQFHTEESLEIKEVNHKLYEKQRERDTTEEEKERLGEEMTKNAQSITTPDGSEEIKDIILEEDIKQW